MRQPLRRQLFLPFGILVVGATVAVAVVTAAVSARTRQADAIQRLERVVETLRASQFPFTPAVLAQMHGLSDAQFVVREPDGSVRATTLDPVPTELGSGRFSANEVVDRLTLAPSVQVGDVAYYAAELPLTTGIERGTLLVLLPVRALRRLGWSAAWPPLAAGAIASLAVLLMARSIAGRFTRRLDAIGGQVMQIAAGSADRLVLEGPDDELRKLATAVNTVSDQLRQQERTVRQTERMRLVAQLSSGLAHQLRNAASGARLAVQLVQRRHPDVAVRELDVALTQLKLIEDHIKRLLAVGPERGTTLRPGSIEDLFRSVEDLVTPMARHSGVALEFDAHGADSRWVPDLEGVRAGLLNVVMNGMEAAGRGGTVSVEAAAVEGGALEIRVSDSGPGPNPDIAERIFEPFVTSKPEGVGLGLAYVRRTIEQLGGKVSWRREGERTRFTLVVPETEPVASGTTKGVSASCR
ncbi:Sensor protein ZraS [Caulifigura coniformis]|uniref:histidine kinase n=1 Tax=Caulifigura coniformis TaxID=2527983 RepID=A0A517SBR7_9PLAN|nr:HAMP domain-containing sensor histidine kinase [Caulifigura coniformis]QDT53562.1 Sensor protein ZraS [Caulifigura coniformis]